MSNCCLHLVAQDMDTQDSFNGSISHSVLQSVPATYSVESSFSSQVGHRRSPQRAHNSDAGTAETSVVLHPTQQIVVSDALLKADALPFQSSVRPTMLRLLEPDVGGGDCRPPVESSMLPFLASRGGI